MEQASISTDEALTHAERIVRLRGQLLERLDDRPNAIDTIRSMTDEQLRAELRRRGR